MSTSIEFRRPGVTVQEIPLPRDNGTVSGTNAFAVITGYLDRGPVSPRVVSSWAQFLRVFGGWSRNAQNNRTVDGVYSYFANLGQNNSSLIVQRSVYTGAATASLTLASADAIDLFDVEALSPGLWGNRVFVQTTGTEPAAVGEFDPGEFDPSAFITGEYDYAGKFNMQVSLRDEAGNVVGSPETFYNLSMSDLSRNYYASIINEGSNLIRVVPKTGLTTLDAPEDTNVADVKQAVPLVGGLDSSGATPTLDVDSALEKLDVLPVPLVIYPATTDASGDPVTAEITAALNYAEGRGDSFVIIDTPPSADTQALLSYVASISPKSAYGAAYYPWIEVVDPIRTSSSVRKTIPPGGSVLATYMYTDATFGPWRSPGGTVARLRNAVALTKTLTEDELSTLNSASTPVNALRVVPGAGICLMGARTLDPTNADRYIGIRRSLNFITVNLRRIAETGLFEPNGPDLWDRLTIQIQQWLGLYYQQGALRGAREPDAFRVVIDSTNNTASTIAAGELHIDVGVAVEFPAEFVMIRLTQHQGTIR